MHTCKSIQHMELNIISVWQEQCSQVSVSESVHLHYSPIICLFCHFQWWELQLITACSKTHTNTAECGDRHHQQRGFCDPRCHSVLSSCSSGRSRVRGLFLTHVMFSVTSDVFSVCSLTSCWPQLQGHNQPFRLTALDFTKAHTHFLTFIYQSKVHALSENQLDSALNTPSYFQLTTATSLCYLCPISRGTLARTMI